MFQFANDLSNLMGFAIITFFVGAYLSCQKA